MQHLNSLNDAQKQAVIHEGSPLCIIAGAGTGKTRVITQRILYLIQEKGVRPDQVLAITFTEKGAEEMRERLALELPNVDEIWIHTFHGFCNKIISENPIETGIAEGVELIEGAEKYLLMLDNFKRFELEYFRSAKNPTSGLQTLLDTFASLKTENIDPQKLDQITAEQIKTQQALIDSGTLTETKKKAATEEIQKLTELAKCYHTYQEILKEKGLIEYGDMISSVLQILKERPSLLEKYQEQFQYVLVDEFQDTNTTQNELIDLLVASHRNLTVVGDDDQAIFRFQGASLQNILDFNTKYPDATKIVLTENYRSSATILDASHEMISQNNPERLEVREKVNKKLEAKADIQKQAIKVVQTDSIFRQYAYIAQEIEQLKKNDPTLQFKDIAVLYRNHSSGRLLKEELERKALPHVVLGGSGLFDVAEVHAIKCILRAIVDIDDSVNLFKVMTTPVLQIPLEHAIRLSNYASFKQMQLADLLNCDLEELVTTGEIRGMNVDDLEPILHLKEILTDLRELAKSETITNILFHIFEKTGFMERFTNHQSIENIQKIYNLNAFFTMAERFVAAQPHMTALDFLDHLAKLEQGGENPSQAEIAVDLDAISLMTIHKSKGLEFRVVFVVDVSEGKLPGRNISSPIKLHISDIPDRDAFVAEERRLFYVAMTRAKETLYLCTAKSAPGRKTEMKPSRFIEEIPTEFKEYISEEVDDLEQIIQKLDSRVRKQPLDTELLKKMTQQIKLSATQIGAYLACPLNYKYKFIYNIPGRPGVGMNFGTKIHEALFYFHQVMKEGEVPSKTMLLDYWEKNWENDGYFDQTQADQLRKHGAEILTTYYDTHLSSFTPALFLEEDFTYMLERENADPILLKGSIDRIDSVPGSENPKDVHIIDYKTGKFKTPNQIKGLRAERRLYYQLLFYALVAKETLGLNPVKTSFYFIEENKWCEFNFTDEDLKEFKEVILQVDTNIKDCLFEPTPDMQLCKWCDYRSLCPTVKQQEDVQVD